MYFTCASCIYLRWGVVSSQFALNLGCLTTFPSAGLTVPTSLAALLGAVRRFPRGLRVLERRWQSGAGCCGDRGLWGSIDGFPGGVGSGRSWMDRTLDDERVYKDYLEYFMYIILIRILSLTNLGKQIVAQGCSIFWYNHKVAWRCKFTKSDGWLTDEW